MGTQQKPKKNGTRWNRVMTHSREKKSGKDALGGSWGKHWTCFDKSGLYVEMAGGKLRKDMFIRERRNGYKEGVGKFGFSSVVTFLEHYFTSVFWSMEY